MKRRLAIGSLRIRRRWLFGDYAVRCVECAWWRSFTARRRAVSEALFHQRTHAYYDNPYESISLTRDVFGCDRRWTVNCRACKWREPGYVDDGAAWEAGRRHADLMCRGEKL